MDPNAKSERRKQERTLAEIEQDAEVLRIRGRRIKDEV